MRFVSCLLLLLAACGKVGDPLPPFIRIPEPVKDLAAIQNGHSLVLTWTNPAKNIDGSAATNLAHVQIRKDGAPMTTVNVTEAGKPQAYTIPGNVELDGSRTFTVIVDTSQGKISNISNSASITPVEVPGKVSGLRALVDERRITLQWQKPAEHPELADEYAVTRSDLPAEPQTVSETRYEDTRYQAGKMVGYQVTPMRRVGGAAVAGVGTETVNVTIEDKTPPKTPTGLEILASDAGVFLTWDANNELDLAGYRVFKTDRAGGVLKPVAEKLLMTNAFVDPTYREGDSYAVSAVDEFGNESARSAPIAGP